MEHIHCQQNFEKRQLLLQLKLRSAQLTSQFRTQKLLIFLKTIIGSKPWLSHLPLPNRLERECLFENFRNFVY